MNESKSILKLAIEFKCDQGWSGMPPDVQVDERVSQVMYCSILYASENACSASHQQQQQQYFDRIAGRDSSGVGQRGMQERRECIGDKAIVGPLSDYLTSSHIYFAERIDGWLSVPP